jgi:GNAT superfamily N-acetyltransferase
MSVRIEQVPVGVVYGLRRLVLRDGRPDAEARFPEDDVEGTYHLAAHDEAGAVVGIVTLLPQPTRHRREATRPWRLRGMAVAPGRQGEGIGRELLEAAVDVVRREGADVLWANGRDTALGFYERNGWTVLDDAFVTDDTGLPHHVVLLDL